MTIGVSVVLVAWAFVAGGGVLLGVAWWQRRYGPLVVLFVAAMGGYSIGLGHSFLQFVDAFQKAQP